MAYEFEEDIVDPLYKLMKVNILVIFLCQNTISHPLFSLLFIKCFLYALQARATDPYV